jgi:hypothetical protein
MNPKRADPDMSLYQSLKIRSALFGSDTRGSMPTEGVMAFSFLIWWYIASFQFFDAYRQKNVNLKAAYTIADMVSRQKDELDRNYIYGLNTVFDYLTFSNKPTWIRVTAINIDNTTNAFAVKWSCQTGIGHQPHTSASINALSARIPTMPFGDEVILVETYMAYEPIFSIGLKAMIYDTFITTRPRGPQVAWDPTSPACG